MEQNRETRNKSKWTWLIQQGKGDTWEKGQMAMASAGKTGFTHAGA